MCSFLSIGSHKVVPTVSVWQGVAAAVISIAMFIGASLLLSLASPVSRSHLTLSQAVFVTPVRETSLCRVVLIVACWLADVSCNGVFCQDSA